MKYRFEERISYLVPADDLDEAEMKMGDEDSSNYEIHRELDYMGQEEA